jgi:hypothetical protein
MHQLMNTYHRRRPAGSASTSSTRFPPESADAIYGQLARFSAASSGTRLNDRMAAINAGAISAAVLNPAFIGVTERD